jgi:hypothetical protein
LLISLLKLMQSAIDEPLLAPPKGGRPAKHPYRHWIAVSLTLEYDWFFDERPTTTSTGNFATFCLAIFDEMECDATGFVDTLTDIADDAESYFAPNRNKRTRRKKRS